MDLTDAEWAALTPDEQDELAALQEDIAGGESLTEFITRISPHHPPPAHFRPVIDLLEAARARPKDMPPLKVCVSMPPGHAKTTLFIDAIAWWLSKYPADTNAYYSYNATLAESKSVIARQTAISAGIAISEEMNNRADWQTTDGGGLLAGGVCGGLTGRRVKGLLIIDDPFKGRIDSSSAAYRDSVDDWFRTTALTRREGASTFVIHTRWHEDDLIGRLAKRGGWIVINLAAIAGEDDILGREPGEALWPEMFPLDVLEERKFELGEFDFAALFQGTPRPRGGTVYGEPHYYDPAVTSFEGCRIVLSADPAASEKTSADYSVGFVMSVRGQGKEAVGYVRHIYRKQVQIPELVKVLVSLQITWGNTAINVESVGGFKAIPQMLRALGLERVNEIVPIGDKFTRAQPSAAAWNVGRILVPSDAPPWLGAFLDEVARFTGVNDKNDDQVDAMSHGWNHIAPRSIFDVAVPTSF